MIKLLIQNPLIPGHTENTYTKVACETCEHWNQDTDLAEYYGENSGECESIIYTRGSGSDNESILLEIQGHDADLKGVITHKDFACALYTPKS